MTTQWLSTNILQLCVHSQVSYLIEEHDREHSLIQDFSFPVITDRLITSLHYGQAREPVEQKKEGFACVLLQELTGIPGFCLSRC